MRCGLAVLLLPACTQRAAPAEGELALGALLPFSGPSAEKGAGLERALILAVEDLNAAAGEARLRLEVRDSGTAAGRLHALVDELLSEEIFALIGPPDLDLMRQTQGQFAEAGVPTVLASSATLHDAPAESTALFPIAPPAEIVACAMANRIYNDGVSRLGVIYSEDSYSTAFAEGLVEAFEGFWLSAQAREAFAVPLGSDRAEALVQLFEPDPDAVAVIAGTEEGASVIFDTSSVGHDVSWYLGPGLLSEQLVRNTPPGAIEGALGAELAMPEDAEGWQEAYQSRWLGEQPSGEAHFMYDAAVLTGLSTLPEGPGALPSQLERVANAPGASLSWAELAEGVERLRGGEDVNYVGPSGSVTIGSHALDPSMGMVRFAQVSGSQIVPESYSVCPSGAVGR